MTLDKFLSLIATILTLAALSPAAHATNPLPFACGQAMSSSRGKVAVSCPRCDGTSDNFCVGSTMYYIDAYYSQSTCKEIKIKEVEVYKNQGFSLFNRYGGKLGYAYEGTDPSGKLVGFDAGYPTVDGGTQAVVMTYKDKASCVADQDQLQDFYNRPAPPTPDCPSSCPDGTSCGGSGTCT